MGKIILYHGTPDNFNKPILLEQKKTRDFGVGFYLTTYYEQAKTWGERGYYNKLKDWERKNDEEKFDYWITKYKSPPSPSILISGKIPFEKYYGIEYYVQKYSIDLKSLKKDFNVKEFRKASIEWFDFIVEYRSKEKLNCKPNHDVTIGPLADGGNLLLKLQMYENKEITKKEALKQIKFNGNNDQYCIHNQIILDYYLKIEGCDIHEYSDNT